MTEIRVTYSGLISFVMGLSTVFTGLIFVIIVTRSLTPEEFGTWGLIGGLMTYVLVLEPIISFWSTREIAREEKSGKTSVISSGIFSSVGMLAYLLIAFFVSTPTGSDVNILLFAIILIPFTFLNRTLTSIALGWKPQLNTYGIIMIDIIKLPAAIIFVYFLDMGVNGAILSMVFANAGSSILLAISSRKFLKTKFDFIYLKKWLKFSWIPSYMKSSQNIVLDVLIFSLLTGSVIGLAYWSAATTIGSLVKHSNEITKGLYPKLLSGGKKEHLNENLKKLFLFAIPLMGFSIAFAKPGLFILNPEYQIGYVIVIFIALRSFLHMLNGIFTQSVHGIDKIDLKNSSTKEYLGSSMFFLPSIRMIRRGVYLVSLIVGIIILIQYGLSDIELVIFWSMIAALTQLPFTIYFYLITRKLFPLKIDYVGITKYLLISALVFGLIYYLMEINLEYDPKIVNFLINLIPYGLISIFSYLLLIYVIDNESRKLFNQIFLEIKKKIKNNSI